MGAAARASARFGGVVRVPDIAATQQSCRAKAVLGLRRQADRGSDSEHRGSQQPRRGAGAAGCGAEG